MASNPFAGAFGGSGKAAPVKTSGANPFAGQFHSQPSALADAPIQAPQHASFFSRVANRLATAVGAETKGQGAADRSLASGQQQLLQIIKNPKISPNRKIGAYRSAMSNYDPAAAAANTKTTAQAYSGKALVKNLGSGLIAAPKYVAKGVALGLGAGKPSAGQEAADRSLESARIAATQALHSSQTSKAGKNRLISVLNGLYDTKAAAANTKEIEDATNKRRFVAAAYETGLQPFMYGGLAGAEGLASTGVTAAQGITGGVLGATEAPKFSSKEALKQAIIQGSIPLVAHGVGAASKEVSAAFGHDQGLNDLITNSKVQSIGKEAAKMPKQKLLPAGDARLPGPRGGTMAATADNTKVSLTQALNKIDTKLNKIDKGEVMATTGERRALFEQRQALASGDLSSLPSVKSVKATATAPISDKAFENITVAKKPTVLGQLKDIGNPVAEFGKKGKAALSSFQSKLGELSSVLRPALKDSAKREAVFNNMSDQQRLKFINDYQHGVTQPTKELQDLADTYKKFNAEGLKVGKTINPDLQGMKNYFTQSGLVSKKDASALAQKWMDKSNTPGSLQHREFPNVQEAIQFANDNGIKIRETNPEKLFVRNHQQVLTSGKLNEFKAEQAAAGVDPQITQKIIDRYSETGISNNPAFQRYRQGAGSVNNVQLVGGFHFAKSAFEKINNDVSTTIHELTAGHPIFAAKDAAKNILQNTKGLGYLQGRGLERDIANNVSNKYTEAVKLANFNTTTDSRFAVRGIGNALKQTQADLTSGKLGTTLKGVALAPTRALFGTINTVMKPLMNKFVPNLKNAAFMNQVDAANHILGPNATKAEKALAYQKAGNTVDGIMGQMNQDNLFWKKTAKDTLSVLMRSPGYNIGTVQQVGGGIKDLLSPSTYKGLAQGKGLTTRSSYVTAMTANTMLLGATATYIFTGKGPKDLIDYFYPPTGKINKNGDKERISLPSYAKDVFAFHNNPGQTVSNKLSPALSTGLQIANNKDYFGNMVRNPQDSLLTQAKQTLDYASKNALPFSVTNANKRVDKGVGAKLESAFGLGVAPGYITKSKFEQNVQSALNTALGSKPLTPEQQSLVNSKSQAKQTAASGDTSKIDALVSSGQITQKQGDNLKSASQQTSLANQFQYLLKVDRPAAAKLIQGAGPDDIKKLGNLGPLIASLQKNTMNRNSKQSTRDASSKLLQVLNKSR